MPHSTKEQEQDDKLTFEMPLTIKNTFIDVDDEPPAALHTDGTQTCAASFFRSQASEEELQCESRHSEPHRLLGAQVQEESFSAEVAGRPPVQSLHDSQDRWPQTATAMPTPEVASPLPPAMPQKLVPPQEQVPTPNRKPVTTTLRLQVPIEVECNGDPALLQQALQHVEAVVHNQTVDPASGRLLLDLRFALGLPQPCAGVEAAQLSATATPPFTVRPLSSPVQAGVSRDKNVLLPGVPGHTGTSPHRGGGMSPSTESSPASSPLVCCHWKNKGFCKYLNACKFQHPAHKRGIGVPPVSNSRAAAAAASGNRRTGRPR